MILLLSCSDTGVFAATPVESKAKNPTKELRLFNPTIFGKSNKLPIKLLLDNPPGAIDPATIQVDVADGKYYAATVRYRTKISLGDARKSLNRIYGKYIKKSFANDPEMSLWRNENDHFSIQLTKEADLIMVIYIDYKLLPKDALGRALSEAFKELAQPKKKSKQAGSKGSDSDKSKL